mgnify:CR=1 FL=1|jgi:hypothetical protein
MRPDRARSYPDRTLANIDIHDAKKKEEMSSFDLDYGSELFTSSRCGPSLEH